jgi:hypothetical protein
VVLLIVVLGGGLFYLNSQIETLLAKNLPEIKKTISTTVGAPVRLDKVSASIFPSPSIDIEGFHILNSTTKKPELGIDRVSLKVALLPLLSKRISVTTLALQSPSIEAKKTAAGVTIKGLPASPEIKKEVANSPSQSLPNQNKAPTQLPVAIGVENIVVTNGSFTLEDVDTKQTISLSDLNVTASVALEASGMKLPSLEASWKINKKVPVEISVTDAALNPATGMVRIPQAVLTHGAGKIAVQADIKSSKDGGHATLQSAGLNLVKLLESGKVIAPAVPDIDVGGSIGFNVKINLDKSGTPTTGGKINLKNISASPDENTKVSGLTGDVKLSGPIANLLVTTKALRLNYNQSPIALTGKFRASPQSFKVEELAVDAFEGKTELTSEVALGDTMIVAASPIVSDISLGSLFAAVKPSLAGLIQGTLRTFTGEFSGIRSDDPARTVSGQAKVLIGEGAIKDYNLAQQVLQSVEGLPFLSGTLRSKVPPEFEAVVANPDTGIKEFRSKLSMNKGTVTFSELYLESDIFSVTSKGSYKPSGELHLPSTIRFNPPFSRAITERVVELKALLDSSGRLELPIVIRGTVPKVMATPDIPVIVRKATVGGVRQAVTGALKGGKGVGKALGGLMGF